MDRYVDCESCLTAAQEIEKSLKGAPAESRQTIVKGLLHGDVCKKLHSFQHAHISKDKLIISCMKLMDSNYDQFYEALVAKEPNNLGIVLCYEQSRACVGVKRQSFEDVKQSFSADDIEALIQANKEKVRISQPVHSGSRESPRDEL
ncbi:hypothetical protein PFLUV_G00176590 [Xyrichtys novacula]|nr:hypothetical protein PFLUV_G00176590 [Xyrichtys novacula]